MPRNGYIQKVSSNGSSISLNLHRRYADVLGWQTGDYVVAELLPDKSIRFRQPTLEDFRAPARPAMPAPDADGVTA